MDVDMNLMLLLRPPVAFITFFIIAAVAYFSIQKYAAKGPDHPDKHLPYSGGQKIPPREVRLSYETFFRIGLLFGIAHVAVLVLATLPLGVSFRQLGLLYLMSIFVSAIVLAQTKPK